MRMISSDVWAYGTLILARTPSAAMSAIWKQRPDPHHLSNISVRHLRGAIFQRATHQRHGQAESVAHGGGEDGLVDPHPRREDGRGRQPGADGPVRHHEHLRRARVLGQVRLLDLDGREDHHAEQHAQPDEQPVGRPLGHEFQPGYADHGFVE